MSERKSIPIGIEDFKEIINKNCCLVDKTMLIKEIIDSTAKVTLFTRPRRFGKTLNMSMLRRYFEKKQEDNSYLFDGLAISGAGDRYKSYMGQYPVISISMKSMKQPTWEGAFFQFKEIISNEFRRHKEILKSDIIFESDKEKFMDICNRSGDNFVYDTALKFLSNCLMEVYKTNVIVLIDEYDVPLENAYFNGFYNEMIYLIRSVFESALKLTIHLNLQCLQAV